MAIAVCAGGASASAQRTLRIYEPDEPELVTPAPITLLDPTFQNPSLEGGFTFHAGSSSNQLELAQCAGSLSGEIVADNANKDEIRLTSGTVGEEGACEGQFGTPNIELGGFPLTVRISAIGHGSVVGSLEVAVREGAGLPASCVYKGKAKFAGKVPTAGALTLNLKATLKSPVRSCLKLYFETDEPESGALNAFGAHEALYASAF